MKVKLYRRCRLSSVLVHKYKLYCISSISEFDFCSDNKRIILPRKIKDFHETPNNHIYVIICHENSIAKHIFFNWWLFTSQSTQMLFWGWMILMSTIDQIQWCTFTINILDYIDSSWKKHCVSYDEIRHKQIILYKHCALRIVMRWSAWSWVSMFLQKKNMNICSSYKERYTAKLSLVVYIFKQSKQHPKF